MKKYFTRMGDGSAVYMTEEEIRKDIEAGIANAVRGAKVDPLTEDEIEHLYNIITAPDSVVSVENHRRVVQTSDSSSNKLGRHSGIAIDQPTQTVIYERCLGCDSMDMGLNDYNFKAVKSCAENEAVIVKNALAYSAMPLLYGGMPNLGFYTKPDGPVDNWAELLPAGKLDEARAAQEEAVEYAVHDMVFVADTMYKVGVDGINLDTCGASGDADWLAALKACEIIRNKYPDMGVEMGMAGEFVLGMHGKLEYDGVRLAGLYPHQQVKLAEKAGATIFGAVVNTNSNMSFAWNLARTCTFIKACMEVAEIPVHVNVGMGVGAIPMSEYMPADVVSRTDKALIEICNIDGL